MSIDADDIRKLVAAIDRAFVSPNVADSKGEAANMVDVLDRIGTAIDKHTRGMEGGLHAIASALNRLAEAAEKE